MTLAETARVLAKIAVIDNRHVDETVVRAWHDVIGNLEYGDALQAVTIHQRNSVEYITPAHIVAASKAVRLDRERNENRQRALTVGREQATTEVTPRTYSADALRERFPAEFREGRARGESDRAYYTTLRNTKDAHAAEIARTDVYAAIMAEPITATGKTATTAQNVPPIVDPGRDWSEPVIEPTRIVQPEERGRVAANVPSMGTSNVDLGATLKCRLCDWTAEMEPGDPYSAIDAGSDHVLRKHPETPIKDALDVIDH